MTLFMRFLLDGNVSPDPPGRLMMGIPGRRLSWNFG
jgi:hypothetical protein